MVHITRKNFTYLIFYQNRHIIFFFLRYWYVNVSTSLFPLMLLCKLNILNEYVEDMIKHGKKSKMMYV